MRTFFYVVWLAIPVLFFVLALWSKLEELSGLPKKDRPDDLVKQGGFVLLCSLIALGIDYYLLDELYVQFSPDWVPLGFYQLILLPFILLFAGRFLGPSKDIRISKSPSPTKKRRR